MMKIVSGVMLLVCACATTKPVQEKAAEAVAVAPVETVKMNGDAVIGDRTKCAVTGETFIVKADSEKYEYEGKTYYFCCDGCLDDFKKDPKKFTSRIHADAAK